MKKLLLTLMLVAAQAVAGVHSYRVHYQLHGNGYEIIAQAESSGDASTTVQNMIPDASVVGVHQVK